MTKKQLSMTIDGELLDKLDALADEKRMSRSECVARLLEQALGDDGTGLVEFLRYRAPIDELIHWMRTVELFKDKGNVPDGDDGMPELVLRVSRRQMKLYMEKKGRKFRE